MKFLRYLILNIEEILCVAFLVLMTCIIGIQIALRTMALPLSWTEEIARYLFVASVYIGCAVGVKKRKHLKVDAVLLIFHARGQYVLKVISNVLFFIFALILGYYSILLLLQLIFVAEQTAPATGISMAIPYSMVSLGMILMAVRLIEDTIKLYFERRSELQAAKLKGGE